MAQLPEYAVLNGKETEELISKLSTLKSHRTGWVKNWRRQYSDSHLRQKASGSADYATNVGTALVNQKLADVLASLPRYDFIGLNAEGRDNAKPFELVWDYEWVKGGVEEVFYKAILEALCVGSGLVLEYVRKDCRTVKMPTGKIGKDGVPEFEDKEIVDQDGPYCEFVRWEDFYIDAPSLEQAGELLVVTHHRRDEWMARRSAMLKRNGISPDDIPKGRRYLWTNDGGTVNWGENDPKFQFSMNPALPDETEWVSEIRRWSKTKDAFYIVCNGIHVNAMGGKPEPMASLHKQLPAAIYTDHYVIGDYNGRGEYDVTYESRRLKDALRSASIDIVKAEMGFTAIDPDSDIDEGTIVSGPNSTVRVKPDSIKHYAPSINSQIVQYMEGKTDEDIIVETGTDFRQQLLSPSETASKTVSRVEAQKKRIALNLKFNAWTFFRRFAMLRASDIMLHYSSGNKEIPTKGYDYPDGVKTPVEGGYGSFLTKPSMFNGKIDVVPDIDSMTLDTTEMQKQMWLQELQILPSLVDSDTGKPVVNPKSIIIAGKRFMTSDLDQLLQERLTTKSPEALLREAGLADDQAAMPMPGAPQATSVPEQDPNYVPPAQRSGAKKAASTPGSAPKIMGSL
jgi:hypothetical protein